MYVCVNVYVCVNMCQHHLSCTHAPLVYVCQYVCCMYINTCIYACMHVYVCACMCVRMYAHRSHSLSRVRKHAHAPSKHAHARSLVPSLPVHLSLSLTLSPAPQQQQHEPAPPYHCFQLHRHYPLQSCLDRNPQDPLLVRGNLCVGVRKYCGCRQIALCVLHLLLRQRCSYKTDVIHKFDWLSVDISASVCDAGSRINF